MGTCAGRIHRGHWTILNHPSGCLHGPMNHLDLEDGLIASFPAVLWFWTCLICSYKMKHGPWCNHQRAKTGQGCHMGQGAYFLHSSTPQEWLEFIVSGWDQFSTSIWESCKSPWALGLWKAHKRLILRKVQHLAIIYRTMINAMNIISWDTNRVEGEEIQIYWS